MDSVTFVPWWRHHILRWTIGIEVQQHVLGPRKPIHSSDSCRPIGSPGDQRVIRVVIRVVISDTIDISSVRVLRNRDPLGAPSFLVTAKPFSKLSETALAGSGDGPGGGRRLIRIARGPQEPVTQHPSS